MAKKVEMGIDRWHYPRRLLAERVLGMFESGLSNALVFFAPRRMGKTEFLRKDIMPLTQEKKWPVFYFSFLDVGNHADNEFIKALLKFSKSLNLPGKAQDAMDRLNKISAEVLGIKGEIEFKDSTLIQDSMKEIMAYLSKHGPVLLLLDEIQILAQNIANENFIASLRTALDIHKDKIKVIFTGSSQAELRRMFSKASAPFFHFGQNLPFPELDRGFTDHLARVLENVTTRKIDENELWFAFERMQKVPQLARSLVERLALNPDIALNIACDQLLSEIYDDRTFVDIWEGSSLLSRLLLKEIAMGIDGIFSILTRKRLAKLLGINDLPVSSLQSALRHLERRGLIGRTPEKSGDYFIDDPNFKNWLMYKEINGN